MKLPKWVEKYGFWGVLGLVAILVGPDLFHHTKKKAKGKGY
jgi:hypothetical protein